MKAGKQLVYKVMLGIFISSALLVVVFVLVVLIGFQKQNTVETSLVYNREVYRVPFDYTSWGHIKVKVTLENGESHPFILDTGASSLLFESFVNEIDTKRDWIMPSLDANLVPSLVSTVRLNEIQLGDSLKFKNPRFETIQDFTNECDRDVKGVLGVNLMKELKWRVNFKTQEIEISDDLSSFKLNNPVDTVRVVQNTYSHHIKAKFSIIKDTNTLDKNLLIDTGYNGFVTMSKFDQINQVFIDSVTIKGMTSKGVNSEKPSESLYLAGNFLLSKHRFNNAQINVADQSINALGLKFFNQFNSIVLDWQNSLLLLEEKESDPSFVSRSFGVSFEFKNNACYLKAAITNDDQNLSEYIDYQILTINGIQIKSQEELCELNLSEAEILVLEIPTGNTIVDRITIKKKPLFQL